MSHEWKTLVPGELGLAASTPGVDPMWVWADATCYRDFHLGGGANLTEMWCVLEVAGQVVSRQVRSVAAEDRSRAELAMPVLPQRMPQSAKVKSKPAEKAAIASSRLLQQVITTSAVDKVLVGVIDSGCPFAHRLLRDQPGNGTRVLGLWDQDDVPAFSKWGLQPRNLPYGRVVNRKGLNDCMDAARSRDGSIHEELCYRDAEYAVVRERLSHGAAVISQLFGGLLQSPELGGSPQQVAAQAEIDRSDLVFVQLPRAGVQDSSSAALARYLIDGLRFILLHAVPGQRVVVNISSGTSRTGHDGQSVIERALQSIVQEADSRQIKLQIVLPIGNTNMDQRHAVLSDANSHLDLFLPPGCETPQHVTVRWPPGLTGAALCVTPPGGVPQVVKLGEAVGLCSPHGECAGIVSPAPVVGQAGRSLLVFAATHSYQPTYPVAPSGRWRLELKLTGKQSLDEPVKFWVSRNQRNPGALARGRQADFIDWDRSHHPQAWQRYREDDLQQVRNGIARAGALSGLATAGLAQKNIQVVGSLFVNGLPHRPSPYSAAAEAATALPGWSASGDSSRALRGLSVHGNHAGEIVRVTGTSFSAPLVARELVNGISPKRGPGEKKHPRVGRQV